MKVLCTTIYVALSFAIVTAIDVGPMETTVEVGNIDTHPEPHTDEENRAANNIIGLLEYARRLMPVGINMFLDVMEPYSRDTLEPMVLDPKDGLLEGTVHLSNLVASGAQEFTIHDIGVSVEHSRLEFNVTVPDVHVTVDYEGINLILAGVLKFNTSGTSEIILTNLNVEGMLGVEEDDEDDIPHYSVVGMIVTNSAEDVIVDVDGKISEIIIEQVKNSLMTSVAETAMLELSGILEHFSVEQVNTFLEI